MRTEPLAATLVLTVLCACSAEPALGIIEPVEPGPPPGTAEEWQRLLDRIAERFPDVQQRAIEEYAVAAAGENPPMLVDVRPVEEHDVAWIPGAVSIPADRYFLRALGKTPVDREIVLYCSVGWRSSEAAQQLQRAGFTNVSNLAGSIFEWANMGRPLENARGPTDKVHPFDAEWGRLLQEKRRAKLPE